MEYYAYGKPLSDLIIFFSIAIGITLLHLRSRHAYSMTMLVCAFSYMFILLTEPAIWHIFEEQKLAGKISFYYIEILPVFLNVISALCFVITVKRLKKI
jgi:hypothetical protein